LSITTARSVNKITAMVKKNYNRKYRGLATQRIMNSNSTSNKHQWMLMRLLFTLCLFTGVTFACNKDRLPRPSQEGKNIFACKVNGKVWIPKGSSSLGGTIKPINGGVYHNNFTGGSNFLLTAYMGNAETVEFFLKSFEVGIHELNVQTFRSGPSPNPENYGVYHKGNKTFMTSPYHAGFVEITRSDTVSFIYSGTFGFNAASSTGETVKITHGRFDIMTPL
jgi:hypothetical protein